MKAIKVAGAAWLVGMLGVALATDLCYVCPESCSVSSGTTPCSASSCMIVCELGPADAQNGEAGFGSLEISSRQAICTTYCNPNSAGWKRIPCSSAPSGGEIWLGPCGLTSGQCCVFVSGLGGSITFSLAGYTFHDCKEEIECVGTGET